MPANLWGQHREVSLNWLALGLLLAAWNAADDGARARPGPLRPHARVTVRSFARSLDPCSKVIRAASECNAGAG